MVGWGIVTVYSMVLPHGAFRQGTDVSIYTGKLYVDAGRMRTAHTQQMEAKPLLSHLKMRSQRS